MFRPRVIPVLQLMNKGLVKTVHFKNPKYVGDPINAVKIFNDLEADELVFVDITASREGRLIDLDFVERVGDQANMPFAVGGGIKDLRQIQSVLRAGAEKVIVNSAAMMTPGFVKAASDEFGSSTIVVSLDVKKGWSRKNTVWGMSGTRNSKKSPPDSALEMQEEGAGEIIINSINRDGTMLGYDHDLVRSVCKVSTVPVIALGGCRSIEDASKVCSFKWGGANAAGAGSLFVYHGPRKAVLVNYPDQSQLSSIFND